MTGRGVTPEEAGDVLDQSTREMLEARARGQSIRSIAEEHGLNPSTVSERLNRALSKHITLPVQQLAALELDRLDRMQEGLWAAAVRGDIDSVNAMLRIMERRAKIAGTDNYEQRMLEFAERRMKLDEAKALAVVQAMTRAIARSGMSVEEADTLRSIMATELRAIEAAEEKRDDG